MSNEKINYLEIPSTDLGKTKRFFSNVFNWQFTDYGDEYCAFSKQSGIDGGFYLSTKHADSQSGSVLVVFYSDNLQAIADEVVLHGGEIVKPTFDFPGGRRFHFIDTTGNEFAVWSDK